MGPLKVKSSGIPLSETDSPALLSSAEIKPSQHLPKRSNYVAAFCCSEEWSDFSGNGDIISNIVTSLISLKSDFVTDSFMESLRNRQMGEGL